MKQSNAIKSALTSSTQRSKSDNKDIVKEGFKLSIQAMEYENVRERHLNTPILRDLGFGIIVTPVVSHMVRNGRKDIALGNGMSISLLLFRHKVIIDDERGETEMSLDPSGDTKRGEYFILETSQIPEFAILKDKMLIGLVYKAYIDRYGSPMDFTPESAALIAAALSNYSQIGSFRDNVNLGKALVQGFSNPSPELIMLEKILGLDTEGLDGISRIVYWTGLLLSGSSDPYQLFKSGHVLVTAACKAGAFQVGNRFISWDYDRRSMILDSSPDFVSTVGGTVYLDDLAESRITIHPKETIFHATYELSQLSVHNENSKSALYNFGSTHLINNLEGWLFERIADAVKTRKW